MEKITEKIELTAADLGNLVRAVRTVPAEEPVLVPVIDPVTGVVVGWTWKIPDPHPLDKIDYTTIPDEAVDTLRKSVATLEESAGPAQLLITGADLLEHGRRFAVADCISPAEAIAGEARGLINLALTRLA